MKRPIGQPRIAHPIIANLNKDMQDFLVCDVLLTEAQLDYWFDIMPSASTSGSSGRKKRKAAFDYEYPNDIWTMPIPYTLDSSLS